MNAGLRLSFHVEEWDTKIPFRTARLSRGTFRMIVVTLTHGEHVGRGEGLPIHYLGEDTTSLCRQVESVAQRIEAGISHKTLLELMSPGAARSAVDHALWDVEAKRAGKTIWELAGIEPRPVRTFFTIGIEDTPYEMAERALAAANYTQLKIKVGDDRPFERVSAIRQARPDARLTVDANQAWTFEQLTQLAPKLAELDVELIEQPLPRGGDELLEHYASPIPLVADESCQHRCELAQIVRRYQIVNIKLDKAGGLTESLLLARAARKNGLKLWVGNMGGTSLGMAPAFVLAQLCDYAELDGHLLLKHDRAVALECYQGEIAVPDSRLWG